ncbi:hypothetical protein [Jeotgalibacillus campisalis]|uniref:Uncharacterized protein n=1 Tax=Jeotgalibacillus campisalis TaxID=220754 RepID=A0A0C2VP66_9BACL|nr:hypothetical protein [Jeotgalibacillus campisalis]KIL46241.1 hypothetical protein KR50_29160 [Jeotgalibacillus campisalis]
MNDQFQNAEIKKLSEEIRKLENWMVRIDEKQHTILRVEKLADEAYQLADQAEEKANEIAKDGQVNTRDLHALETRFMWSVGLVAPFFMWVVGEIFAK